MKLNKLKNNPLIRAIENTIIEDKLSGGSTAKKLAEKIYMKVLCFDTPKCE